MRLMLGMLQPSSLEGRHSCFGPRSVAVELCVVNGALPVPVPILGGTQPPSCGRSCERLVGAYSMAVRASNTPVATCGRKR